MHPEIAKLCEGFPDFDWEGLSPELRCERLAYLYAYGIVSFKGKGSKCSWKSLPIPLTRFSEHHFEEMLTENESSARLAAKVLRKKKELMEMERQYQNEIREFV